MIVARFLVDTSTSKLKSDIKLVKCLLQFKFIMNRAKVYVKIKKEQRDMSRYFLCVTTTASMNLEINSALVSLSCPDTSKKYEGYTQFVLL